MQHLLGTGRNIRQFYNHETDALEPEIEMVLTVYERTARFVGASITQTEECSMVRVGMTPKAARLLANNLKEWADEADDIEARTDLTPKVQS
jgi:hypothetical protein